MRDASTVYFALLRWPLGLISKELKVFPLRVNTWGPPSVPNWLTLTGRRIWSCGILPLSCVSEKHVGRRVWQAITTLTPASPTAIARVMTYLTSPGLSGEPLTVPKCPTAFISSVLWLFLPAAKSCQPQTSNAATNRGLSEDG